MYKLKGVNHPFHQYLTGIQPENTVKENSEKSRTHSICIIRQDVKNKNMKLYDDCLIFFLKKNICTDTLPSTIQNDISLLRKLYQVMWTCTEKAEVLDCLTFGHSLWWEEKLENIDTVCLEWDGCPECYEWNEIEEEKRSCDVALEKMSEELEKLRDEVKDASMKIPKHLSHLTDRLTSLCILSLHVNQEI